ncbi:SPASM domain-containing protein [Candidatus Parcubacteria bacterium]|nr:MAG: SPASM domain-containing protein [Candidatus Parcubacteria bacterium]
MRENSPWLWLVMRMAGEDDCACSNPLVKVSDGLDVDCACSMPSQKAVLAKGCRKWRRTAPLEVMPLPGKYRLVWGGPHVWPVLLNPAGWEHLNRFDRPHAITLPFERALAATGLIVPEADASCPPAQPRPQTLTLWLHVTNACDLDCSYCYVNKTPASLSFEQGIHVLRYALETARAGGFEGVKVKYAGGEPSLLFRRVQRWHRWLETEAAHYGLAVQGLLLTNGMRLSQEHARWLKEHAVQVMVSLDGIGAVHDRLRVHRHRHSTFSAVEHTVDRVLLPMGLRPTISMTLTRLNVHHAPEVARWAVVERGLPLSFNFYRGVRPEVDDDLRPDATQLIEYLGAAYRVLEAALPIWPFTGGLLDRVRLFPHRRTCGVGEGYLVVRHTGDVAACHMLLDQPVAVTPSITALHRAGQQVHNLPVEEKECAGCSFAALCSGGCPLETYHRSRRWDARSPYCEVYRALLPRLLRLEGLRLLKAHGMLS